MSDQRREREQFSRQHEQAAWFARVVFFRKARGILRGWFSRSGPPLLGREATERQVQLVAQVLDDNEAKASAWGKEKDARRRRLANRAERRAAARAARQVVIPSIRPEEFR